MAKELKACPFCGGDAESRLFDAQYFVQCVQCFNSTAADHELESSAIAAWNTRAQLPSQGGEAVACFRILNTLGDVLTEWQDGPPPARFTDVCGVVQTDVFAQVAYTHPADQVAEGVVALRDALISIRPNVQEAGLRSTLKIIDEALATPSTK